MIETKDNRKFFTQEKNFPQLIEFANTFKANISLVNLEHGDILDLSPLAVALSTSNYSKPSKFDIIERKITSEGDSPAVLVKNRRKRHDATVLKAHITTLFETGNIVDVREIARTFRDDFTPNSVSAHVSKVKKDFDNRGQTIVKLSTGRYRVSVAKKPRKIEPIEWYQYNPNPYRQRLDRERQEKYNDEE